MGYSVDDAVDVKINDGKYVDVSITDKAVPYKCIVKADVPLSEMFGYVTSLRTLTSGRATSSMEFSHYSEVPRNIAEEVIAKSKK